MSKKIETLAIKDLTINLFVRKELDQNHALKMAEFVEEGVNLPPILVARRGTVIDGRHRIEAYLLNDRETIEATRLDIDDDDELAVISAAYQANLGGSLPPTKEDTEHTVLMLLERKASKRSIAEMLQLPVGLARKYIASVEAKQKRASLQKAASAVTGGGFTVPKAAEVHGVEVEDLRELLGGGRKRRKPADDAKRQLTMMFKSHSQKVASVLKSALQRFEDGESTERTVREIMAQVSHLQKESSRRLDDWRRRFEAIKPQEKTKAS